MLQSLRKIRILSLAYRPAANVRRFSDDEKGDKKEKNKDEKSKNKVIKNEEAVKRLNSLLESMSSTASNTEIKIQTAKKKKYPQPEDEKASEASTIKEITHTIATKIGGDVEKVESELLSQLLGTKDLKHSGSLSDLISGMKVENEKRTPSKNDREKGAPYNKETYSRAENVRRSLGPSNERTIQRRFEPAQSSVNLFGSEGLGIFTKASTAEDPLETWSRLEKRERKLAITHPPSNYFEKMMMWTDQGKLWTFPIDNEQGMEEEKQVDFSEHVLLEMHLEDWCPTSGPVRHFMELVCVGLSKNHFLTAKEKKDHIYFYRDYFEEKKHLLGDLMSMRKVEQPQIEA